MRRRISYNTTDVQTFIVKGKLIDGSIDNNYFISIIDKTNYSIIKYDVDDTTKHFILELQVINPHGLGALRENPSIEYVYDIIGKCNRLDFDNCTNLKGVNIESLDGEYLTMLDFAFNRCDDLEYVRIKNLESHNELSIFNMIRNCIKLTTLEMENVKLYNIKDVCSLASNCSSLITIKLTNCTLNYIDDHYDIFGITFYEFCDNVYSVEHHNYIYDKRSFVHLLNNYLTILVVNTLIYNSLVEDDFKTFNNLTTVIGNIVVDLSNGFIDNRNYVDVSHLPLDNATAERFINGLVPPSQEGITYTLYFRNDTYNTLNETQKQIAYDKRWIVTTKT